MRSPVTGPHLPVLRTRNEFFESVVVSALEYLRAVWPDEMRTVQFDVATIPTRVAEERSFARWRIDRRARRVVLYRVPIERLAKLHRDDEWHRRSFIESCVFRAVAELLGKDPWELAPERYRHF